MNIMICSHRTNSDIITRIQNNTLKIYFIKYFCYINMYVFVLGKGIYALYVPIKNVLLCLENILWTSTKKMKILIYCTSLENKQKNLEVHHYLRILDWIFLLELFYNEYITYV